MALYPGFWSGRLVAVVVAASLVLIVGACSQEPDDTAIAIEGREIRAHMAFLADDLLEGREAGTRGEALAALYIRTQFEALGLEPAGDGDSYLQTFRARATTLEADSVAFRIDGPGGQRQFDNGVDIAVFGNPLEAEQTVAGAVVFAGAGIVAPEFGIDDYAGLDVAGKVVAVLGGPPAYLPAAEAAHFGSTDQQRREAEARGAIGVIILWTDALEERFAFDRYQSILGRTDLDWLGPDGVPDMAAPGIRLRALIRGTAIDALFDGAPRSFAELVEEAQTAPPKGFDLATRASLTRRSVHDDSLMAMNVAGLLPGGDPTLADEVVVVTAHYDHVGIGTPVDGDAIYNGAGDNAYGTAVLIEVARRIAAQPGPPPRSILFLAVGAEEKGLIGSDYFAEHPTLARERLVANINIDGGLIYYDFADVIGFGAEHSQMQERLEEAAGQLGLTVAPDPFPEQGIFTRSDQYSFVKRGIPAVFLFNGFTSTTGGTPGRDLWDLVITTRLHQPNDDMPQPFDYAAAAKLADVARRLTLITATAPERPRWYDDSVFGQRFAPDAPKAARPVSGAARD